MIAMDPEQTVTFRLKSDQTAPDGARPEFVARHLTCREMIKADALLETAANSDKGEARCAALVDVVLMLLAGWRDLRLRCGAVVEYLPGSARDVLLDTLTPSELAELAYGLINAVVVAESDAKKSDSPSPSNLDKAAASAVPA